MAGSDTAAADGDATPPMGGWKRLVRNPDHEPLTSRLRDAMLRPVVAAEIGPDAKPVKAEPVTVEELEAAVAKCDDKERLVGLVLAPLAALVGLLVTGSLIANDPAVGNVKHVSHSLYLELGGVSFLLALVMLAMAWYRKRLYLGLAMALFGLSTFNLHFWGFGIPFILGGSWYLVRAYRLSQKLKLAKQTLPQRPTDRPGPSTPNKRYTPPTAR